MNQISIKELYQKYFGVDNTKTNQLFAVSIGDAKITDKIQFHPAAPVINNHENSSNSCCLSSLVSSFHSINDNRAVPALVNYIEESLTL